jgi:hypothetical protein
MASLRVGLSALNTTTCYGQREQFVLSRNPILAGALNRISQDVDMVTVRVNYRFGWGTTRSGRHLDLVQLRSLK